MVRFPCTARLEVERKFTALKCSPLRIDGGHPPFSSLKDLGLQRFRDIYYDSDARLSKAGTYVRQRNGLWQMKVKRGGTFVNSRSQELSDPDIISSHVKSLTGRDSAVGDVFGLTRWADFTTIRQTWEADHEFKIVLDQTDFGHSVGEVELETEMFIRDQDQARHVTLAMDDRIDCFFRRYAWAFLVDRPVGKLTAYFEHHAPERA
ncbi:hypothetical protein G647_03762 [Cladophialophora carrionii CBS 160.54]|uniref:CYTH domain-containing protein n=1 Tax=Cladophialophora carrionii CBS 160.54 TaxID=1279043 RepID=V9DDK6_9EURO|nr:uncharacterized protein G647_03762 [Cladophialophora carrionii CBS 160.54]ETI24393.1 hypothetical protein G647_03762 [Cladophialophora carrionii CBS 160.54]